MSFHSVLSSVSVCGKTRSQRQRSSQPSSTGYRGNFLELIAGWEKGEVTLQRTTNLSAVDTRLDHGGDPSIQKFTGEGGLNGRKDLNNNFLKFNQTKNMFKTYLNNRSAISINHGRLQLSFSDHLQGSLC